MTGLYCKIWKCLVSDVVLKSELYVRHILILVSWRAQLRRWGYTFFHINSSLCRPRGTEATRNAHVGDVLKFLLLLWSIRRTLRISVIKQYTHKLTFPFRRGFSFCLSCTHQGQSGRLWLFWQAWWRGSRCTCLRLTASHHWCWWSALTMMRAPAQSCCPSKLNRETDQESADVTDCLNASKWNWWRFSQHVLLGDTLLQLLQWDQRVVILMHNYVMKCLETVDSLSLLFHLVKTIPSHVTWQCSSNCRAGCLFYTDYVSLRKLAKHIDFVLIMST